MKNNLWRTRKRHSPMHGTSFNLGVLTMINFAMIVFGDQRTCAHVG